MHLNRKALLFVFLAVCLLAAAEENNNVDDQEIDKSSVAPVSQNSGDIIIPGNLVKMVLNGGAVAAGVMIFTALATLVWPVLATKMCHVFGTCGEIYPASSYANTAYQQPDYGQASYGQTFNNPTNYQKRSIEYISPVLKALGNAYEKYNHVSASASANKAA